jgi:hypothetical protein
LWSTFAPTFPVPFGPTTMFNLTRIAKAKEKR